MNRKIAIGAIQFRLVIAGRLQSGFKIVGDDQPARPLKKFEGPDLVVSAENSEKTARSAARRQPRELKPYRFKAGQNGNPGERPKTQSPMR
jgi:hypothetical protein